MIISLEHDGDIEKKIFTVVRNRATERSDALENFQKTNDWKLMMKANDQVKIYHSKAKLQTSEIVIFPALLTLSNYMGKECQSDTVYASTGVFFIRKTL